MEFGVKKEICPKFFFYIRRPLHENHPIFPLLTNHQQPPNTTADPTIILPRDILTSLSPLWNTSNWMYWSVMLPVTPPLFSYGKSDSGISFPRKLQSLSQPSPTLYTSKFEEGTR